VGIRGPGGGAGGVIRGPGGGAVGGIRGPEGGAIAGARTPWGGSGAIAQLPDGSTAVHWNGSDYWHDDGHWYAPGWDGEDIWYWPIYPPVGWFTPTFTCEDEAGLVVINNTTYYVACGVYYEKTTQNGQEGYVVAEEPKQAVVDAKPGEPNPFDVLKKGMDYLARQQQFAMAVSDTYDEVTESGQKVSYASQRNVCVRRPNKLAIDYRGDRETRRVVLDGENFTLLDRTKNAYGQAPMNMTIDAALDKLAADYSIVVAVAEWLRTNLYDRVYSNVQTGQYLGRDTVLNVDCDHLAFTTAEADMEVWFEAGERPLLRKFSLAYKNVPVRPRYTMTITSFDPSAIPDNALVPKIPAGATEVNFTTLVKGK
jgi:hypothetical protein